MRLRMSKAERDAFLMERRNGVLSIAEPDGGTIASPVWYLYDPIGTITIHLNDPSLKLQALQRTGRATLTVQDEGDTEGSGRPLRYVSVTRSVIEDRDFDVAVDVGELWAFVTRYLGEESGRRYVRAGGESYLLGEPEVSTLRVVRLRAERWFTRDYGKAGERWDEMVGIEGASGS